MKNFVIEPLKGFGEIPFGMSLDDAVKQLGSPNFYEELSDMGKATVDASGVDSASEDRI